MASMTVTGEPTTANPELEQYRQHCRQWLQENLAPIGQAPEPGETLEGIAVAKAVQAQLFDGGFAGISWPEAYGGQGLTMAHQRIFNDEAANFQIANQSLVIGLGMCAPTLLENGSEEQKRRHIARMLRGDEVWCQLFSEPGAGSDVASLQTRAVRDGDEWVVNGQKVWTSGAQFSDYGILIARTNPDAPKHRGITMFILDMRTAGVTIRPLRMITGASGFNEVFLDDVRIPGDQLVGTEDDGWRAAIGTLMNERVSIGAGGGGLGRRVGGGEFDRVVELARQRGALDQPRVRDLLANVYCTERVLSLLSDRIRAQVRAGQAPGPEGSIAKLVGNELAQLACDAAFEIGGQGAQAWDDTDESAQRVATAVLAYPGNSIAGGTTEVMKNILGERVLGLPKEPQVDKDVPFRDLRFGRAR